MSLRRCDTVIDQQVGSQAPLCQDGRGCRCGGEHVTHGDVEAHPLELGHELLPAGLGLIGAEAQLQV